MLIKTGFHAFFLLVGGLVLALTAAARGQVGPAEHILKDRARSLTNTTTQRNINPNYIPPAKAKTAPATRPVAVPAAIQVPDLTGAQLTAAKKLRQDLDAIETKPDAVSAHTETLTQDLMKAAAGTKQPALTQLISLAADLATGWPAQKLAEAEKGQFANSLVHLLNCNGQPAATTQKIYQNTDALLKKSGMADAESRRISGGLKTIITQLQR